MKLFLGDIGIAGMVLFVFLFVSLFLRLWSRKKSLMNESAFHSAKFNVILLNESWCDNSFFMWAADSIFSFLRFRPLRLGIMFRDKINLVTDWGVQLLVYEVIKVLRIGYNPVSCDLLGSVDTQAYKSHQLYNNEMSADSWESIVQSPESDQLRAMLLWMFALSYLIWYISLTCTGILISKKILNVFTQCQFCGTSFRVISSYRPRHLKLCCQW